MDFLEAISTLIRKCATECLDGTSATQQLAQLVEKAIRDNKLVALVRGKKNVAVKNDSGEYVTHPVGDNGFTFTESAQIEAELNAIYAVIYAECETKETDKQKLDIADHEIRSILKSAAYAAGKRLGLVVSASSKVSGFRVDLSLTEDQLSTLLVDKLKLQKFLKVIDITYEKYAAAIDALEAQAIADRKAAKELVAA